MPEEITTGSETRSGSPLEITVWQALKAINRRLPPRVQRLFRGALNFVGIHPPRTTDDAANDWAQRGGEEWLKGYGESWDRPHRHLLVECVARFEPVSSVLELGCHAGPNLRLLATRFPTATITGVDVNLASIEEAHRSLAEFRNVIAKHADLRRELESAEDDSVDCIVSCFALAYVDPTAVVEVLAQSWRAARKALVLMEPHPGPDQNADPSGWRHDYPALLKRAGCRAAYSRALDRDSRVGELNAVTIAAKAR